MKDIVLGREEREVCHRHIRNSKGFDMVEFATHENLPSPQELPPWLAAFAQEARRETETLRENGAEQAAAARTALLQKLLGAAQAWLDTELDSHEAAQETGRCEETIRRLVRAGAIPDRRANPRGRHRIRRRDLQTVAPPESRPYDPIAYAQSIAQLRRKV